MTSLSVEPGAAPAPMSLPARFFGIITSPRDTFASVAAHPKWLGMMLLCIGAAAVLIAGFLFTQVGQDAWLDTVTTGRQLNDQQLQTFERIAPYAGYFALGQTLVIFPLVLAAISGILFAVFNAALGGQASFKQVFAVVVHAGPVGVIGQLFSMPLNYYRGTLTSAANLGSLLPMLGEQSFASHFLGAIDVFLVWQLIVLAIGLGVLYKRRTQPIAISLLSVYAVIAVIVAVFKSRAGGA
ncbi:MAG TPA: YIP1 family protein [Vicinamibacterales bacterium]|jgi:hypothetical protein|nr:YIP1 family protein [Vicinamibacterales bacterium]